MDNFKNHIDKLVSKYLMRKLKVKLNKSPKR